MLYVLVPSFINIVNVSIRTGKFPNAFKVARVVPTFMSGSKSTINKFRPISLLSALSKISKNMIKFNSKRL